MTWRFCLTPTAWMSNLPSNPPRTSVSTVRTYYDVLMYSGTTQVCVQPHRKSTLGGSIYLLVMRLRYRREVSIVSHYI